MFCNRGGDVSAQDGEPPTYHQIQDVETRVCMHDLSDGIRRRRQGAQVVRGYDVSDKENAPNAGASNVGN